MRIFEFRFFNKLALTSVLLLLIAVPVLASAQELIGPQKVIKQVVSQLQAVLEQDKEKLNTDPGYVYRLANEVLVPYIDFNRVSSLVLGKHWRKASATQKVAFTKQFQRLLVRTYSTAFREFKNWDIQYSPLRVTEGSKDVSVHTKVMRPDAAPVSVVYRMHSRAGDWMAYDVKIEGISLVTNYRSRFSREVRQGGMNSLIQLLTELNDKRAGPQKVAQKG